MERSEAGWLINKIDTQEITKSAKLTLEIEERAIADLKARINDDFLRAVEIILGAEGRVIVIGIGKSGHIARKIAATLASTGTPSFFVHASEAGHGDIGMLTPKDVPIMISYSGNSGEILNLLSSVRRLNLKMIAITGDEKSALAKAAAACLLVKVAREACPMDLAPTASTTASLAMGDALAMALLSTRDFTADDFALSHPSGSLGRKLLLRVSDIMRTDEAIPRVAPDISLQQALVEMTSKTLGMTTIVDEQDRLVGIFTDGDLRRCLDINQEIHKLIIGDIMIKDFLTIRESDLAAQALKLMEDNKINSLPVLDKDGMLVGAMNMHDLLSNGMV